MPGFMGAPGKGDTGLPGAKGDQGAQGIITNIFVKLILN